MPVINRLLCIFLLACLSPMALGERLRLVSDDWAPYIYRQADQPTGIDYEVTTEVFRRLGVEVEWEFLPWKRCLAMVEQGLADGVMDIFKIEARKGYMVYPVEPMSDVEFVLYQASKRRHVVDQLSDLRDLTVGTSPGYAYGPAFEQAAGFTRESAQSHEANFGKLVLGRIDLLVTDRMVGRYLRRQLGLEKQVEELPLVISRQSQYLGLARKPGREKLAQAFADELRRFKQEPAYVAIIARYIGDTGHLPDAVEQQESSTQR
ncbi:substrate-binding periplasmic protein [Pseudomonas plecoglossicida]|uniref:Amino acid ABC transporter substrate-binding protein n=1 Tax=Pseudomonas plecoglossicida TaxID=70775 RepID=A0AAD0QZ42_PSEDL|nr:transporter substrate-binding domain-containing protein [Pseudomonas plecoglossicida]AXM96919.1 amino acid ABC transporter substrate-binding protein [Pseudomonas plecoglossicida]EPB93650.1 extracellular solute-binding protein [Pseudomonas plecoglossicida NB2011]QLB53707.1 amino acid ABC transporter substrate-binding protein [Pseudomonas plecoglossicida]GLR36297.1 ABC transporter substrate-binding protein [Pseudomonas plecoglossicida]